MLMLDAVLGKIDDELPACIRNEKPDVLVFLLAWL